MIFLVRPMGPTSSMISLNELVTRTYKQDSGRREDIRLALLFTLYKFFDERAGLFFGIFFFTCGYYENRLNQVKSVRCHELEMYTPR